MPAAPFRAEIYAAFAGTPGLRVPERKDRVNWDDPIQERPARWLSNEQLVKERLRQAALALREFVEVNARKLGGVPLLKGTRFSVAQVLSQIGDGDSIDDLAENFDLDRDQLATVLHALAACLNRPFHR